MYPERVQRVMPGTPEEPALPATGGGRKAGAYGDAQISRMMVLNAAATGAMGVLAGMSLAHAEPDHVPAQRIVWRGAAGVGAAALAIAAAAAGWRSKARAPLVASAALALAHSAAAVDRLPIPGRKGEVVSGETKLIRLYRRDARLSGLRTALQVATLFTLLFAAARD